MRAKKLFILLILGVVVMSSFAVVNAFGNRQMSHNLKLFEKENFYFGGWNIVWGGASGNVLFTQGFRVHAIMRHLNPYTDYTLIYYGYGGHNDEWPYATCIASATTSNLGNARTVNGRIIASEGDEGYFDYTGFINDGVDQKFWIVLSEDVDCENHMMIAWNPQEYLFEYETV